MNNIKNILWGIILVIIGVIIGLNTIGITDIDILLMDGDFSYYCTMFYRLIY